MPFAPSLASTPLATTAATAAATTAATAVLAPHWRKDVRLSNYLNEKQHRDACTYQALRIKLSIIKSNMWFQVEITDNEQQHDLDNDGGRNQQKWRWQWCINAEVFTWLHNFLEKPPKRRNSEFKWWKKSDIATPKRNLLKRILNAISFSVHVNSQHIKVFFPPFFGLKWKKGGDEWLESTPHGERSRFKVEIHLSVLYRFGVRT